MLGKLVNALKNNPQYLYIGGFLLLVVLVYFFDLNRLTGAPSPSPYTIREPRFELVSATPPSRLASSYDPYEAIWFEFSEPVVASSLSYTITPTVVFNIVQSEEDPKILKFIPRGDGWVSRLEYTLKITNLRSTSGNNLNRDITYIYYNDPPSLEGVEFPY